MEPWWKLTPLRKEVRHVHVGEALPLAAGSCCGLPGYHANRVSGLAGRLASASSPTHANELPAFPGSSDLAGPWQQADEKSARWALVSLRCRTHTPRGKETQRVQGIAKQRANCFAARQELSDRVAFNQPSIAAQRASAAVLLETTQLLAASTL
jgi:hypothetical protein